MTEPSGSLRTVAPEAAAPHPGGGRHALLVTAERMIAEDGIAGVSMRKIVRAAGQGNNYAVQHHFGDKAGLVSAILEMRLSELNTVREGYLRRARERGELDIRTLVAAIYMPMAELVDEKGRHVYVRFLARVMAEMGAQPFGLIKTHSPAGNEVTALMRQRLPHLDDAAFNLRMDMVRAFFFGAITSRDPGEASRRATSPPAGFIDEVINLCTALFLAPAVGARDPSGDQTVQKDR